MLQEQRIGADGVYTFDKVQVAIDRLRAFEALALEYSPEGYYLCDSGGKDSSVIKELAIMAGVKCGDTTITRRSIIRRRCISFAARGRAMRRWESRTPSTIRRCPSRN